MPPLADLEARTPRATARSDAPPLTPTHETLEQACNATADPEPPGQCRPELVSELDGMALLRLQGWERSYVRLAVRLQGRWRVAPCDAMVDTSVSALHTVVDVVRGSMLAGEEVGLRYVRHDQYLEPRGVGANGNGDGPMFTERSVYEDHLVVWKLSTNECADRTELAEAQPERVVRYSATTRQVPVSFRASVRMVGDSFWGIRLR